MEILHFSMTSDSFKRLPRNAAYRYEYLEGDVYVAPRPRYFHSVLELPPEIMASAIPVRPVEAKDLETLESLFQQAFRGEPPFAHLDAEGLSQAARNSLSKTRNGGDGPLVEDASFVAYSETDGAVVGANFITLLPGGDLCNPASLYWSSPAPADMLARRLGQPHLTWIFVDRRCARRGVGTALLHASIQALKKMGYERLASTFINGSESSMLWHWRNGFRLVDRADSWRSIQKVLEDE